MQKRISVKELNIVLDKLRNKEKLPEFGTYSEVDIVLIAGLFLWYKQNESEWQKIPCFFNIKDTSEKKYDHSHYFKQIEQLYNVKHDQIFDYFPYAVNIKANTFSQYFAPPIYITNEKIDCFFGNKKDKDIEHLKSEYISSFDISKLIDKRFSNYQSNSSEFECYEKDLIKRLHENCAVFVFVFLITYFKLSENERIKDEQKRRKDKTKAKRKFKEFTDYIDIIWQFTQEYVRGLHELAKNIVEHSGSSQNDGQGMITIRTYSGVETDSLKVLETHVFDFGTKGIIPTLIEETEKNKVNGIFAEDLEILNKNFTLDNFINPTVQTKLNQQLYRELAHYGLIKFYKLIEEKIGGDVICSSIGSNRIVEYYPKVDMSKDKTVSFGTSYFFQLPFKKDLYIENKNDISNLSTNFHGTQETIKSLSVLMNYVIIDYNNTPFKYEEKNVLLNYNLNKIGISDIKNRNNEVEFFKLFIDLQKIRNNYYIAINMENISLSASSLLRFFAHISTKYKQQFIIYNLNYQLYAEMLDDNKQFLITLNDLGDSIPYWYKEKGILIFSKLSDISFNFADILYGSSEEEFLSINYIISRTFPNAQSIINNHDIRNKIKKTPKSIEPFFFQSSLLPFDLLLYNETGKELFLSNLEILVSQELKNN